MSETDSSTPSIITQILNRYAFVQSVNIDTYLDLPITVTEPEFRAAITEARNQASEAIERLERVRAVFDRAAAKPFGTLIVHDHAYVDKDFFTDLAEALGIEER